VDAVALDLPVELFVVGDHEARVAVAAEGLGREEGVGTDGAHRARLLPFAIDLTAHSKGFRRVLEDGEAVALREVHDALHRRGLVE